MKNKLKILLITIVSIVVISTGIIMYPTFNSNYNFKYVENQIPPSSYDIKLDKKTRELSVEVYHSNSTINGNGKTYNYNTILTQEEMMKIDSIIRKIDKDQLAGILECIARDAEPFNDPKFGTITYRKFGDNWLHDVIMDSK